MDKESKIYIAGHTGLVGSALWKNLLSKGYNNLIGVTIDELNLIDTDAVNDFFDREKPDYVILAAAKVGGIVANNTYRGQFIYENLMIQNNVINASYLYGVKKLLFLGSTCIYPRDANQPLKEDYLLTSPLEYTNEPYAIAKIAGIKMCENYNLQYGTNFISVMPTNLYGPNDNFNLETSHVLPALIRKIHLGKCMEQADWQGILKDLKNRPIEGVNGEFGDENRVGKEENEKRILAILRKYGIILVTPSDITTQPDSFTPSSIQRVIVSIWGTGFPLREFLWSEEMAEAAIYCLEEVNFDDLIPRSSDSISEIRNTHINIGTGKEISIRDLAYLIKDKIGYKGEIVFDITKPDGTMRKLTDPSRIHNLGWHHKIEIEEGIEKLYNWYLG